MADMDVRVRLTGDGGQLVGQLKAVADAEKLVAKEADGIASATKRTDAALDKTTRSIGAMRSASTNLGFQIQDITQSLALGISPIQVFGQQAGQTAAAVSGMGGAVGRVGTFLAGPFGSLVLAGVTVLGFLLASNKDNEKQAKKTGDALDFQRQSTAELTDAILEQLEAAEKSIRSAYAQESAALAVASANLAEARAKREVTKAAIEDAIANQRIQAQGGQGGVAGTGTFIQGAADSKVLGLQGDLAAQQANLDRLATIENTKRISVATREVEAALDGASAATLRYDKAVARLNDSYTKSDGGAAATANYTKELTKLARARDVEIDTARKQEAQAKKTTEAYKGKTLADFALPFGRELIGSGFGQRARPTAGASTNHKGLDFKVAQGTPVRAAQDGVIDFAGLASGFGNLIKILHGAGTETRYAHLSKFAVADGQDVKKGDVIGYSGGAKGTPGAGTSTGSHLHYEVLVNGKQVDPRAGRFPFDPVKVAETAERAAEALEGFGERASNAIAGISARYDEQPKLIDDVAKATRDLDAIIEELAEKQPLGFQQMIADAEAAKQAVVGSLVKPFQDLTQQHREQHAIQSLILAGREDEANTLRQIQQLQERVGAVSEEQRQTILDQVVAEREINEALEQRQKLLGAYLGAVNTVRDGLTNLLSGQPGAGGDLIKNLKTQFKQLQGQALTEQIFGPALKGLEQYVKEKTAIQSSVDIMTEGTAEAGDAATVLAGALERASQRADNTFTGQGASGGAGASGGILRPEFGAMVNGLSDEATLQESVQAQTDEIVVLGQTLSRGALALTPAAFFAQMSQQLTSPLLDGLDSIFGTKFFGKLSGVFSAALEGFITAGPVGAVLAGGQKLFGDLTSSGKISEAFGAKVSEGFGKALKGAQTGTQVAGIGKALGIKTSTMGGQIGGAIGSALPIPGGEIIGSIIGSVVGGLFKKTPYGTAKLTGSGDPTISGNKAGARDAAGGLGDAVQSGLRSIAEQLGAELGAYNVSIGMYKDKYRVSASGKSGKLKGGDVKDFGKDGADDAVAFAIVDAIRDGAIGGLSAAVQKAITSGSDPDKALSEALKTKQLESLLGGFLGSAQNAFAEFEKQAKERLRIATAYGLEISKVEELNAKDRIKLRTDLERAAFGSLQDLLERMRTGDLFEGSAVDQRTALLAKIETAKGAAASGEEGAADKLAQLLDQLNTVSRNVFGTTGGFATDRSGIEGTAENVIGLLRAQLNSADPNAPNPQLDTANAHLDENNDQNAAMLAELKRIAGTMTTGGGAPAASGFNLPALAYTGGADSGISGGSAREFGRSFSEDMR